MTNRINFKQINSIVHHNYEIDKICSTSTIVLEKKSLDFNLILFDLPEYVRYVKHAKVNGTSLRPELVIKYKSCGTNMYGLINAMIEHNDNCICIIQDLETVAFRELYNSYEVKLTERIMRIPIGNIFTKKTYSLWKRYDSNDLLYISLKYVDE